MADPGEGHGALPLFPSSHTDMQTDDQYSYFYHSQSRPLNGIKDRSEVGFLSLEEHRDPKSFQVRKKPLIIKIIYDALWFVLTIKATYWCIHNVTRSSLHCPLTRLAACSRHLSFQFGL